MMEGSYVVIQQFMCRDMKLSGNELIVYAVVHGFSQDGKSYFYGGAKYISEKYNISERTVYSILDNLTRRGLLVKKTTKVLPSVDRNGDTKIKKAAGSVFYVLYATSYSRAAEKGRDENGGGVAPENEKSSADEAGAAGLPEVTAEKIAGVQNPASEKIAAAADKNSAAVTAEKIAANNKFNNKFKNKSAASESGKLNPQSQNLPETKNQKTAEADFITEKLKSLFGGHFVFDASFPEKLRFLQKKNSLANEDFAKYLDFVKSRTDAKNPENPASYYFKSAVSDSVLESFLFELDKKKSESAGAEKKEPEITCPACGTLHSLYINCPSCNLDYFNISDGNAIKFHRLYFSLPAEKRKSYDDECRDLEMRAGLDFKKRNELYSSILRKYGLMEK